MAALTVAPTATPVPTQNLFEATLVLHVDFDGVSSSTVYDDSGNGFDGTVYGGATTTTSHDGSNALYFDGSDDYVEFPSGATADILGSSARTVCLWAKIDSFNGGTLFSYDSNEDTKRFGFMTETTTSAEFRMLAWGSCCDVEDVALSGSDDGDWHHYCHTYDGTDLSLIHI